MPNHGNAEVDDHLTALTELAVSKGARSAEVTEFLQRFDAGTRERRLADAVVSLCAAYETERPPSHDQPSGYTVPRPARASTPLGHFLVGSVTALVCLAIVTIGVALPWHERSLSQVQQAVEERAERREGAVRSALATAEERVRKVDSELAAVRKETDKKLQQMEARAVSVATERAVSKVTAAVASDTVLQKKIADAVLARLSEQRQAKPTNGKKQP